MEEQIVFNRNTMSYEDFEQWMDDMEYINQREEQEREEF